MTRFLIIPLLILSINCFAQLKEVNQKLLDKELQNVANTWQIPAMSVAIVKDGKIEYEKAFGVLEEGKSVNADIYTNFAIASNTKAFTSAALGILVDQGQIKWDDKVKKYIPNFELYDSYVTSEITIRDILSHRTGLETFSGDLIWYASNNSREKIINNAKYLKPKYGFREKFGYSNIMYLIAGEIIKQVTDTTWDNFVKERIFKPLNMTRTNTSIIDNAKLTNVASCHAIVNNNNVVTPYINWDNIAPAGSINSNAHDMAQWLILQLSKGKYKDKKIYSEQVANEMWSPQTIIEIKPFTKSINPSTHIKSYALGWTIYDYKSYLIVTHNGGYDGMISQTLMIPELNTGFVILTNSNSLAYNVVMYQLLDYIIDSKIDNYWSNYFIKLKSWVDAQEKKTNDEWLASRKTDTKPSLDYNQYTGTYISDIYGKAEISINNNKLYLKMLQTPIFQSELNPWHYDTFTIKFEQVVSLPEGTINFIIDKYGKVSEMQIDIPNPDFDFTELKFYKQ